MNEQAYVELFFSLIAEGKTGATLAEELAKAENEQPDGDVAAGIFAEKMGALLAAKEYRTAYRILTEVFFGGHSFAFHYFGDEYLRYLYLLLEASLYEAAEGKPLSVEQFADIDGFAKVYGKIKFSLRRLWLGVDSGAAVTLENDWDSNRVSDELAVIMMKYGVPGKDLQALLEKMAVGKRKERFLQFAGSLQGAQDEPLPKAKDCAENEMDFRVVDIAQDAYDPGNGEAEDIAFIFCANREDYVEEVAYYLSRQKLGAYKAAAYIVYNAQSMTQGYNAAMSISPAKIKIYIHQDTFIYDPDYTSALIEKLSEGEYQMLGVAGSKWIPENGVWFEADDKYKCMNLYQDFVLSVMPTFRKERANAVCEEIVLDGVLLATAVDIPWRDDLFGHFHFYDVSQSLEFVKAGYHIGVF